MTSKALAHLSRQMYKALHELETLQKRRSGRRTGAMQHPSGDLRPEPVC